MKKRKRQIDKAVPCEWLRQHRASTKPAKKKRFELGGEIYWELTDGSHVHEYNLRHMEL